MKKIIKIVLALVIAVVLIALLSSNEVPMEWKESIVKALMLVLAIVSIVLGMMLQSMLNNRKRNKYMGNSDLESFTLEELKTYVEKSKYDAEAFVRIGVLLAEKENYDEAYTYIEKGMGLSYRHYWYRRIAGNVAIKAGDYGKALKYHKGSFNRRTVYRDYDYFYRLGKTYIALGNAKKGSKNLKTAQKLIKRHLKNDVEKSTYLTNEIESLLSEVC